MSIYNFILSGSAIPFFVLCFLRCPGSKHKLTNVQINYKEKDLQFRNVPGACSVALCFLYRVHVEKTSAQPSTSHL